MNDNDKGLRLQDLVARASGTSLKTAVKVLRALPLVLDFLNKQGAANDIDELLLSSAYTDDKPSPLHTYPGKKEVDACNLAYHSFIENITSIDELTRIHTLTDDPYFAEAENPSIES